MLFLPKVKLETTSTLTFGMCKRQKMLTRKELD